MSSLLSEYRLNSLNLKNRLVMAPMTRCRATNNVPNALMIKYYEQRASAGLIVTEGTSPSPNGLGYARIPGIFTDQQVQGWKHITTAVHNGGAKIFVQLMHTGRVSHPLNLPPGAQVLAPSAVAAAGEMFTDAEGIKPLPVPQEMTTQDIRTAIDEFARGATNAMRAGFDGIELHSANGYLLEQFIRPNTNRRGDGYGGDIKNRARFVLEVVEASIKAIGEGKVGIRLSPYGVYNDMPLYGEMENDYTYLAKELSKRKVVYVHLVDHSSMGAPPVPVSIKEAFRSQFPGTLILCGGYDMNRAQSDLAAARADLIAVGRPFLANPDLIARWQKGAPLNEPDYDTFYTLGEKGYTDYPVLA